MSKVIYVDFKNHSVVPKFARNDTTWYKKNNDVQSALFSLILIKNLFLYPNVNEMHKQHTTLHKELIKTMKLLDNYKSNAFTYLKKHNDDFGKYYYDLQFIASSGRLSKNERNEALDDICSLVGEFGGIYQVDPTDDNYDMDLPHMI